MTSEEEERFRGAARRALASGRTVAIVGASDDDLDVIFELCEFPGHEGSVGIIVPATWEHAPDFEARIEGILSEEQKALAGIPLD